MKIISLFISLLFYKQIVFCQNQNLDTKMLALVTNRANVLVFDNINQMLQYKGNDSIAIVKDFKRGGLFIFESFASLNDADEGVVFKAIGLGKGVWRRQIEDNSAGCNILWFGGVDDGTGDNFNAISKALNSHYSNKIYFPKGVYLVSKSITLNASNVIQGESINTTVIKSSHNDFVFKFISNANTINAEIEAPKIRNLTILGYSGIQFNDPLLGFTDRQSESKQNYLMRPIVDECKVIAKVIGSGIGIQWSKCFDGVIQNSDVESFMNNLEIHGCDLCSILNNRIRGSYNNLINIYSYNTFGSQTLIFHNDLLSPIKGGFILSSDRSIRIIDNYFEGTSPNKLDYVVKLTSFLQAYIRDNRVEVPAIKSPVWLDLSQIKENSMECIIENNTTSGPAIGAIKNPDMGYPVWVNGKSSNFQFQNNYQLTQGDKSILGINNYSGADFKFVGSTQTLGLLPKDYVRVKTIDNSFVLPPMPNFNSMIDFNTDITTLNNEHVNIYIVAKSDINNQILNIQRLDDNKIVQNSVIKLNSNYTLYKLYENVDVKKLVIKLWNSDLLTNSKVYIKYLIVK